MQLALAQQVVEHTFPGPGTYAVTLTVTDNDGGTHSITKMVTVTAPDIMFDSSFE